LTHNYLRILIALFDFYTNLVHYWYNDANQFEVLLLWKQFVFTCSIWKKTASCQSLLSLVHVHRSS